jgi:uncharacterized protein YbjT (DUF2867 family)
MHLILGASGQLGSRVARRLLSEGEPVRAVSREPARLTDLVERGAEAVPGDLLESAWIPSSLAGVRTLLLASHGLVPPSRRNHPEAVDGAGTRRMVDAAVEAGVERVVFISSAGAEAPDGTFVRLKAETEAHLRRKSTENGLRHTIFRPTVFMENHALLLMGEPLRDTGTVSFFGRGETPLNWISTEDLADRVVEALRDPGAPDTVVEAGGPQVLTRRQALQILEEALGRKAKRRHLPLGVVRAVKGVAGPFHPGLRCLLELVVAEEAHPDRQPVAPERFHWIGSTPLQEVAERWARGG